MGTLVLLTPDIYTNCFQLDLSHLMSSLTLELACLAHTSRPLLYSMLENAACHDIMSGPSSKYCTVRRSLRALTLKHLESDNGQGSSAVAATTETLLIVNELLMTELSDWNVVLRSLSLNCNAESLRTEMSSQPLLSWAIARFGES